MAAALQKDTKRVTDLNARLRKAVRAEIVIYLLNPADILFQADRTDPATERVRLIVMHNGEVLKTCMNLFTWLFLDSRSESDHNSPDTNMPKNTPLSSMLWRLLKEDSTLPRCCYLTLDSKGTKRISLDKQVEHIKVKEGLDRTVYLPA